MYEENYLSKPPVLEDYIPDIVKRLLDRIKNDDKEKIILYGFSDNLKWLNRLLKNQTYKIFLADWRLQFVGYDCGGERVQLIDDIQEDEKTLIVICIDEIISLKEGVKYLINNRKKIIPTIYDRSTVHSPYLQEEPYRSIRERAIKRAKSMISDQQLFELIQFVDQTRNISGDIVEYGTLYGGTGAIIAEAAKYFSIGEKKIWLFDSFEGIPKSSYGLDYCWQSAFSDNSFSEVKNAFSDLENVELVNGNIVKTFNCIPGSISFGYIASDTMETGQILMPYIWEKLSPGGIISICDYGSYPNAVPLTVIVDEFFQKVKNEAYIFHPTKIGIFAIKK